jgi:uncharacterized BrkB/YihY/UPF0761 family membrane protein
VPLTLLGLALLSVFGLEGVWRDSIAPAIQSHATQPVFHAIDFSVEKIFSTGSAGLIAFAAALLVWDMTAAVFTIMQALNEIHDVEEDRSWPRRADRGGRARGDDRRLRRRERSGRHPRAAAGRR